MTWKLGNHPFFGLRLLVLWMVFVVAMSVVGVVFAAPCRIDVRADESLRTVRDRVRALPSSNRVDGVEIILAPGIYALEKTLNLQTEDSGLARAPVVWRAADPKSPPQLVGGIELPLSAFRPIVDPKLRARLAPKSRDRVLEADISRIRFSWPDPKATPGEHHGAFHVPDVYAGGRRLKIASFPAEGWSEMVKILDRGTEFGESLDEALAKGRVKKEELHGGVFAYAENRPSCWAAHPQVAIEAFWRFDWRKTVIMAKSIDPRTKTITLSAPHQYGLGEGNPAPRRWRALNVFEELNAPGRYVVDFANRRLYLYPPDGFSGAGVCSANEPLVCVRDAHDIEFHGIHFGRSAGNGLKLLSVDRISVVHSLFTDARDLGLRGSECRNCIVRTCDFRNLGGGGLFLEGGDRRKLKAAHNLVEDCLFHDWNELQPTTSAAIVGGVGNAIRHCLMRNTSHQATGVRGNDNVFEYNVLSNICTGTDDAGAFYKGCNPSARGNVIRYNFFRNIGRSDVRNGHGAAAIYLDDGDGGDFVIGNVFENATVVGFGNFAAVFSHGGHANVVRNCLFVDCGRALGSAPWTQERWAEFLQRDEPSCWMVRWLQKDVDITKPPYTTHYPELIGFLEPQPDAMRWNSARDNAFVNCPLQLPDSKGRMTRPGLVSGRWQTNETCVVIEGDPGFVNRSTGDLRLKADSQVYRRIPGFKPIPFERIGLLTPEGRR